MHRDAPTSVLLKADCSLAPFEYGRHTLSATDTHGLQPKLGVLAFHFVQKRGQDTGAGCGDWMAQGYARAIDVQVVVVG